MSTIHSNSHHLNYTLKCTSRQLLRFNTHHVNYTQNCCISGQLFIDTLHIISIMIYVYKYIFYQSYTYTTTYYINHIYITVKETRFALPIIREIQSISYPSSHRSVCGIVQSEAVDTRSIISPLYQHCIHLNLIQLCPSFHSRHSVMHRGQEINT